MPYTAALCVLKSMVIACDPAFAGAEREAVTVARSINQVATIRQQYSWFPAFYRRTMIACGFDDVFAVALQIVSVKFIHAFFPILSGRRSPHPSPFVMNGRFPVKR